MKIKLLVLSVLLLSACSEEDNIELPESSNEMTVVVTAKDFVQDNQSRTSFDISKAGASFKWAAGDTIGILPDEGAQAYFSMVEGDGANTASFTGGGWALKPSSIYGAYYPFVKSFDVTPSRIPVSYNGQVQDGNATTTHLGKCDFMLSSAQAPVNGKAHFDFEHMGCLAKLDIKLSKAVTLTSIELIVPIERSFSDGSVHFGDPKLYKGGYMDLNSKTMKLDSDPGSINVTLKNIITSPDKASTIYFMMPPVDLSNYYFVILVKGIDGIEQTLRFKGVKFNAGKAYDLNKLDITVDKTYHVSTPGTLSTMIDDSLKYKISSLTVTGNLETADIKYIRDMLGLGCLMSGDERYTLGHLHSLDLKNANIVSSLSTNVDEGYYMYLDSDLEESEYWTMKDRIGEHMFEDAYYLYKIELPHTAITLAEYALNGCTSLRNLTLPPNLKYVREYSLGFLLNLDEIVLPPTVESLRIPLFGADYTNQDTPSVIYLTSPKKVGIEYVGDPWWQPLGIGGKSCTIYVPSNLLNEYKSVNYLRDNWCGIKPIPSK